MTKLGIHCFDIRENVLGASIYDVRTERGEGGPSKADIVSNLIEVA